MSWRNEPAMALPGVPVFGIDFRSGAESFGSSFSNPLYPGADPWIVRRDGWYYLCQANARGQIELWKSPTLTDRGQRQIVWSPPRQGWNRAQVWAPELHFLRGRWHIYYTASGGRNPSHRMGVLQSTGADPQGVYTDRGMLYTGDDIARKSRNRWAIDGTVLELHGRLYLIWSGWEDRRDVQHLYLAPMSDPCTISGARIRLCANDCHLWERVGERRHERGLHEGPQVLHRNGKVFLIFSCSGSWQPSYKLGMLHLDESADPTNPANWKKAAAPVFESTSDVFGVGHCCFTQSPDGAEDWMLYHSKNYRWNCWDRVVRAQRFAWSDDGFPVFGLPTAPHVVSTLPSGHHAAVATAAARGFRSNTSNPIFPYLSTAMAGHEAA